VETARKGPEGTCKYLSTISLVCRLTTSDQGNHRNQLLKEQEKHRSSGCDQSTARHMGKPWLRSTRTRSGICGESEPELSRSWHERTL